MNSSPSDKKNAPGRKAEGAIGDRDGQYNAPGKNTNEIPALRGVGKPFAGAIAPEELDPAALTISMDYAAGLEKKTSLKVPIMRPNAQVWFCPSEEEAWHHQVAVLDLTENCENDVVVPPTAEAEQLFFQFMSEGKQLVPSVKLEA